MKEYTFNDNGVCTNPDIVQLFRGCVLEFAQDKQGRWYKGVVCHIGDAGFGIPCSGETYATREEAEDAALASAYSFFVGQARWNENNRRDAGDCYQAAEQVRKYNDQRKQLTLF